MIISLVVGAVFVWLTSVKLACGFSMTICILPTHRLKLDRKEMATLKLRVVCCHIRKDVCIQPHSQCYV